MSRRSCLLVLLFLSPSLLATGWERWTWCTNTELTPLGSTAETRDLYGRVHSNGFLVPPAFPLPLPLPCSGLFSQGPHNSEADLLEEGDECYGRFLDDYPLVNWDLSDHLIGVQDNVEDEHRWAATAGGDLLTTLLRFDGSHYRAAQYAEAQITNGDTVWHVPWESHALPDQDSDPVIWIEGVGRVKGVVEGRITVLCSDSLFIMGDLIPADTVLSPCPGDPPSPEDEFGFRPAGSPNVIGLIGKKNVIIAATIENGLGNGGNGGNCGWPDDPVISHCAQAREGVVITASIIALDCCFQTEFWKTTASSLVWPAPEAQIEDCPGQAWEHVDVWPCSGASPTRDLRGRVWFYGSLASRCRGLHNLLLPNELMIRVGYDGQVMRHDPYLESNPPPAWPTVRWIDSNGQDTVPMLSIETEPATACGLVTDLETFRNSLLFGDLGLRIQSTVGEADWPPLEVLIKRDGHCVDTMAVQLSAGMDETIPGQMLLPWIQLGSVLWIEAHHDLVEFNPDGVECRWEFDDTTVVKMNRGPTAFTLHPPYPNPFNPVTQVELELSASGDIRIALHDLQGRLVTVIHDGHLPAGLTRYDVDGRSWSGGIYLLDVESSSARETRKLLLLK